MQAPLSAQRARAGLGAGSRRLVMARTATLARPQQPVSHIHHAADHTTRTVSAGGPPTPLAFEMLQGNLVRFARTEKRSDVPTAVLVHGILGSKKNLRSYAHMLIEGFPTWQVLLVDLRCHGESAAASGGMPAAGPCSVQSAARDVLNLLRQEKLFPNMLIGHSFGGKVILDMVQQFGARLPRPVQAWVLDTLPGEVRAGGPGRADHPADLIATLRAMPMPCSNRNDVVDQLLAQGFSRPVAQWVTTNLRPKPGSAGAYDWTMDLPGIAEMYESYEATSCWELLSQPPQGLVVDFVRAERSNFRWEGGTAERIAQLGHRVHVLRDAGHWVHIDNPGGLFDLMAPSFGAKPDLHMQHAVPGARRR